jgi:hypothetical protein
MANLPSSTDRYPGSLAFRALTGFSRGRAAGPHARFVDQMIHKEKEKGVGK